MALADRAELAVRLTLDDRGFTGPLRRVQGNLAKLNRATSNTQRALGRTGAALQRTAAIAAAAAATGFVAVVKAAGDFELAFAGVEKTVEEELPGQLDTLRKKILDLSTTMPIAATELAAIGETAGALGIHIQDIDEFIEVVAKLGVTTNLTTDEAAESLGKIGTILGLTGQEFEAFADILVNLGNKGASTEAEIIEITKRFAASGKQAGLTIPEILAFSSAIASAGAEPEAAGSSLSRLFGNIITETALASDKGKEFAEVTGKSFADFSKLVEKDTVGAMLLFLDSLRDLDKFSQQEALENVGITNVRDRNAILLLAQTFDENLIPALQNAEDASGALDREAATFFDTFNNQWQTFKNTLTRAAITIGDKLLPKIRPLLTEFATFVRSNGPAIEKFGDQLADAFVGLVANVRALPWDAIVDGIKGAAFWSGKLIQAFTSMPGWMQSVLIGAFAINKATGGLVTGITKDLGGALFNKLFTGSFFERGGPTNPMFVTVVGGLPGAGVVPGGGGIGTFLITAAAGVALGAAIYEVLKDPVNRFLDQWATTPISRDAQGNPVPKNVSAPLKGGPPAPTTGGLSPDERQENNEIIRALTDSKMIAAAQARTNLEQNARLSAMRAAIERTRLAIITRPMNFSVVVNSATRVSVSAGAVQSSITTHNTWTGGRTLNRSYSNEPS